jgi:DNA-binding NtrC family response regulator
MPQQLRLLFGTSAPIAKVLHESARFAKTGYPLLLLGEPGTGKSVLARHVHDLSGRLGSFIKESAAAIPEHLEVAHLGGHARGSFTGAHADRMGLLEAAHRGTFFLDELGLASGKVQEILLQVLDGQLRRLGEVRDRQIDVRLIAATNAELEELVDRGTFRRDLRDRFGYLMIRLPPLAQRRDEVLPLADHFLRREAEVNGSSEPASLSGEVRACLMAAPWKGNIRELEAVCRYAVLHAEAGGRIELADLPPEFLATVGMILQRKRRSSHPGLAREALEKSQGNKTAAARLMGISRRHIHRLLAASSMMILCELCDLTAFMSPLAS